MNAAPRRLLLLLLAFSFSLCLAAPAVPAGLGEPKDAEFVDSSELPIGKDQAWKALLSALQRYRVKEEDSGRGQAVSEYIIEEIGPNRYRTTVTGIVQKRGNGTVVSIRAQREVLMEALTPGIFTGAQKWQKVGGNRKVSDAVMAGVLKAAGVAVPAAASGASSSPAPAAPPASSPAPPAPAPSASAPLPPHWEEIQRLKMQRNDLMAPIRELDKKALEIVYSDDAAERQKELQAIKDQRMKLWEGIKSKVMEIDQKILELALSEQ